MKSSSGPVNILHNGMKTENHILNQAMCNVSAASETRESSSSLSSVRKLPKKRKFDLRELEENPYSKPENNIISVPTTNHYTSNVTSPQSIAVDYSCMANGNNNINNSNMSSNSLNINLGSRGSSPAKPALKIEPPHLYYSDVLEPAKIVPVQEYYKADENFSMPAINMNDVQERNDTFEKPNIALHEWIDHRVLAKRNGVYLPGTIRKADSIVGNIWIELDNSPEGELILFLDVLQSGRYDVISDASPSVSQVNEGTKVCVRVNSSLSDDKQTLLKVFVEGVVYRILTSPVRFVVRLIGPENQEYIASRADIRLLQPPWAEELENDLEHELPPPLLPYGNVPSNNINNNVSILASSSNVYQSGLGAPLDTGSSKINCRSAATSPSPISSGGFMPSGGITVIPGVSMEEQKRRHVDEYSESDDDMRRENIMFSLDGGNNMS